VPILLVDINGDDMHNTKNIPVKDVADESEIESHLKEGQDSLLVDKVRVGSFAL
jgi:hypothetical protein